MGRKRQEDKPLTPEQFEEAGRAAFTGAHQDWPKIQGAALPSSTPRIRSGSTSWV